MPQNQRRASGLAMVMAAMSSSSPGRIGVSMATTSRPAGSRMKPLEARPTQVACVHRRVSPVRRFAVEQGHVDGVEGFAFSCLENAEILVNSEHARFSAYLVSDCKSRLPRRLACNLLDVHAPAAHRERLFLHALRAATRAQRGRSREKG